MELYCGTYKKYNEGSLEGAWINLDDFADADDFRKACLELHKDEDDPELMFQDINIDHDWEEKLYSECAIPEDYWDVKEAIKNSYIDDDIFDAFMSIEGGRPDVNTVKRCEECYITHISDSMNPGADYAEMEFEDTHSREELKSLEWIMRYIDWDAVWRDMTFDGYHEENGYIFDTNR